MVVEMDDLLCPFEPWRQEAFQDFDALGASVATEAEPIGMLVLADGQSLPKCIDAVAHGEIAHAHGTHSVRDPSSGLAQVLCGTPKSAAGHRRTTGLESGNFD